MNTQKNTKVCDKELRILFSEIDTKINDLYQCSAKDFKQLNVYLKDYYKKTNIIFKNAFSIIETIGGGKSMELLKEFTEVQTSMRNLKFQLEEENNENIQILEKILAKVILLTVTMKNFKQDLITYKFLATNFRLLSNYQDIEGKNNEAVLIWEKFTRYVKSLIPALEDNLEIIKEQLYITISKSKFNLKKSRSNIRNLMTEMDYCIRIVNQKNSESAESLPFLSQKTENSSRSINNIITNLQYHDIIRQKIEHIQKAHSQIITNLDKGKASGEVGEKEDQEKDYHQLGSIAELQAAQLILVNKEYQIAIEDIINSFQQIGFDLTTVSNISHDFSFDNKSSEFTLINEVKNKLDSGINLLDLNNFEGLQNDHQKLTGQIGLLAKDLDGISVSLKEIRSLDLLNEAPPDRLSTDDKQIPKVISQLSSQTSEAVGKLHSVIDVVSEIEMLASGLRSGSPESDWGNQLEKEQIALMVHVSRVLDQLDNDHLTLNALLAQNKQLSEEILLEIKGTIQNVDYYDFFEKVIEEIIVKLNTINLQLKPGGKGSSGDKKVDLEELKQLYTMKSERLIHQKVESSSALSDDVDLFETDQEEEDSVELF